MSLMSKVSKSSYAILRVFGFILWWIGLITVIGVFVCWPIAYMLFAFSELVENSNQQRIYLEQIAKNMQNTSKTVSAPAPATRTPTVQATAPVVKKVETPTTVKPTTPQTKSMQDSIKESTYYFAIQMYQQGKHDVALDAFLKVSGYKDSDTYINKLQELK